MAVSASTADVLNPGRQTSNCDIKIGSVPSLWGGPDPTVNEYEQVFMKNFCRQHF